MPRVGRYSAGFRWPSAWWVWGANTGSSGGDLVLALFERIEVLGIREATVFLTAEAARHGFAAALPGEVGISVDGRGEKV